MKRNARIVVHASAGIRARKQRTQFGPNADDSRNLRSQCIDVRSVGCGMLGMTGSTAMSIITDTRRSGSENTRSIPDDGVMPEGM